MNLVIEMAKSIIQHHDENFKLRQRVADGYINLNDISKSTGKRLLEEGANKDTINKKQALIPQLEKADAKTSP